MELIISIFFFCNNDNSALTKFLCCRGKIKILKYKSINNVKKGNNTLYAWKINDI